MKLVNRAFLQTLGAASTSLAVLDTQSGLWMPAPPQGITRSTNVEEQLEVNELARLFALKMADRLEQHPAIAMREVMYKLAGHVELPPALPGFEGSTALEVQDQGIGYFRPAPSRLTQTADPAPIFNINTFVLDHVDKMFANVQFRPDVDMFAPIGAELSRTSTFSDDVTVGLAADPESGLCVRVLRFDHERMRYGGGVQRRTMFELAGGQWGRVDLEAFRNRQKRIVGAW